MKTSSRKAKGRVLQDWIRDTILEFNPELAKEDVRAAIMGETGTDIKLTKKGQSLFPFKIEAKNVEKLNMWDAYDQATAHKEELNPVVFIKKNRRKPVVVMDAELFIVMVRKAYVND